MHSVSYTLFYSLATVKICVHFSFPFRWVLNWAFVYVTDHYERVVSIICAASLNYVRPALLFTMRRRVTTISRTSLFTNVDLDRWSTLLFFLEFFQRCSLLVKWWESDTITRLLLPKLIASVIALLRFVTEPTHVAIEHRTCIFSLHFQKWSTMELLVYDIHTHITNLKVVRHNWMMNLRI